MSNITILKNTAKPLVWNDYVTMNTDFSNGESRGRSIVYVSSMTDNVGQLKQTPKEDKPDFASFQLLRPATAATSTSIHDSIKWTDLVVLSAKNNHDEDSACGLHGCKIAYMNDDKNMQLQASGDDPYVFRILPPLGLFRSSEQCVLSDDKLVLVDLSTVLEHGVDHTLGAHGGRGLKVISETDKRLQFYHHSGSSSDFSFRHIHRHRTLQWRDHVLITTGFQAGGSLYGNSVLYTDSLDDNVSLKEDYKTGNPQITSFRILPPEVFSGTSRKCISWGDQIEIKLNNNITEAGCDNAYGCRLAYVDSDGKVKFSKKTESAAKLYIHPPFGLEKSGCVHAGDQLHLMNGGMAFLSC
eukprot:Awhi_evm1s3680